MKPERRAESALERGRTPAGRTVIDHRVEPDRSIQIVYGESTVQLIEKTRPDHGRAGRPQSRGLSPEDHVHGLADERQLRDNLLHSPSCLCR